MGDPTKTLDAATGQAKELHPLHTAAVDIDDICVGDRWVVTDEDQLAKLIAVIAIGQADYAAHIIEQLIPAAPAFTTVELCREAKIRLTVQEKKATPRKGYPRWQRDGFMFEAISWIMARQANGTQAYLKSPHISSTSQGLDGLMIELPPDKSCITTATVFEDKCTDHPRSTFVNHVIPSFSDRHKHERSAELVSTASTLLRIAGIDQKNAAILSAAVMALEKRKYRAAFALSKKYDSQEARKELFDGFEKLEGINKSQRVGAGLIVPLDIRPWFDALALKAVKYLNELEKGGDNV